MEQGQEARRAIVVGVDGSDESAAALAWAIDKARELHGEVVAIHSLETPFFAYYSLDVGVPPQLDERWREGIKQVFEEEWCRPLKESGVPYRTLLVQGRPATAIAEEAERLNADLVVVGRRGRGGVARMLLGSVSSELVQSSLVPVVVLSGRDRQ
jgi:nucleotide-binding universal stress UspA family protein